MGVHRVERTDQRGLTMASEQAEAIKEQLRVFSGSIDPNMELPEMRAMYADFASLTGEP